MKKSADRAAAGLLAAAALILTGSGGSTAAGNESAVYHSPAALAADPGGKMLYIADFTARQIAVYEIASQSVRTHIALPDHPSGLVLSANGLRLYATNAAPQGKVYVVDTTRGAVVSSIAVGHTPNGPVLSPDGRTLYVCNRFTNDVSVIDLDSMAETGRIAVSRQPVAARLAAGGNYLFVANQLPAGPSDAKEVAAVISVVDTRARRVSAEIRLPDGGTGVRDLCLSPDGTYLYVAHLLARYQAPASQIERGWIQTNAVSIIDAVRMKFNTSVLLDDITLGAANPWAVACTPDGKSLLVAHAGTHEISVIDRVALHTKIEEAARGRRVSDVSSSTADVTNDLTFLTGIRTRVPLEGNGPRSLAVIGQTVYVGEYFTGSLGVLDLHSAAPAVRSVPLGKDAPITPERRGEMLFHDAQYCYQKWLSCSSCHPHEARPDGLNWDLMLDGVGNAKNTKSLLFSHQTPPTTSTGARPNAEASVRAGFAFIQFARRPEEDAASVDAYLKSLEPAPSPYLEQGKLSAAAERGKQIFQGAGCSGCHSGRFYTGMGRHNVGTGRGREKGVAYDTPTLIEVWRTAPYLHDGRAVTIKDMLMSPDSGLHYLGPRFSAAQIEDLAAFVLSL
jgi:YVTN family beta-propeller protein